MGLDKKHDYYFRVLDPAVYYKVEKDTLFVYTSYPANPPDNFGFNVVQVEIKDNEYEKYEQLYHDFKIQKVVIDSFETKKRKVSF
jgi:hypothetical protein